MSMMEMDPVSADYFIEKRQIEKKLCSNWEAIIRKYDRLHKDDADIDLDAFKVVGNTDFVEKMPTKHVGWTVFASNKRCRKQKMTKGLDRQWNKYERTDSALGSMGTDTSISASYPESHDYPPLGLLDFSNADPDESGAGFIRYQYNLRKDRKPLFSGPQDLLTDAAESWDFDTSGSEDEDDASSVGSGPVNGNDSFTSQDLQSSSTMSDYDDTEDKGKEDVVKHHKTSPCQKSDKGNEGLGNAIDGDSSCESGIDSSLSSLGTSGITSILEAKENFVKRVHRLFIYPVEGGMAWESDGYLAENDSTTTSCSDIGGSTYVPDKPEINTEKTSAAVSAPQVPKHDKNSRETSTKLSRMRKSEARPTKNRDFDDNSTILAGNLGVDVTIDNKDALDNEVSICDENKTISNHSNPISLNRTLGGGLKLPSEGTTKHVVIGSVPLNIDDQGQRSDKQERHIPTQELDNRIHQPDPRNTIPFITPKSKFHSKSKTPKTPCSPRTPRTPTGTCILNSEEMLEIFQSPLPLTLTPKLAQIGSTQFSGKQSQSHRSPSSSKFSFEFDFKTRGITNETCSPRTQESTNHFDIARPSPLAKALKKMQREAKEGAEQVLANSPRHNGVVSDPFIVPPKREMSKTKKGQSHRKELKLSSPTVAVHKDITDHTQKQANHVQPSVPSKSKDDYIVSDQPDTYEFQSSMSWCETDAANSRIDRKSKTLSVALSEKQQQPKECRSAKESHDTDECVVESPKKSSNVKESHRKRNMSNNSDIPSVSKHRQFKIPLNKNTVDDVVKDSCSDDDVQILAVYDVVKESCSDDPVNILDVDSSHKSNLTKPRMQSDNALDVELKVTNDSYKNMCTPKSTTPKTNPTVATHAAMSPSCLTSPLNYLSLQSPSNSTQGRQSQNILERTPTSSKKEHKFRTLFGSDSNSGIRHHVGKHKKRMSELDAFNKFTNKTKSNSEQFAKLQNKCVSPNKQMIMTKVRERSDQRLRRSATRKLQPKSSPCQLKQQDKVSLVTSTPIKSGPHQADLDQSAPATSKNAKVPVRLLNVSSKHTLNSSSIPHTRHSPEIRNKSKNQKMNSTDRSHSYSSRLQKKCTRKLVSRKQSESSEDSSETDDDLPSTSTSCSVTLTSSNTCLDNSSFNTGLSTSSVACEGFGKCTKMFCFMCAVSDLS